MSRLAFTIVDARIEPYAMVPTLIFRLQIADETHEQIHAIALRSQIQVEPRQRRYAHSEEELLVELFGGPERWSDTLKTLLWTHASLMVPGFQGVTVIDLPITCTYDFEVVAAKYLESLEGGEVPLVFLFSGTIFTRGQHGFSVEQIPWEKEANYRLPVRLWRELMDRYFPGSAWIRLSRESFNALYRFKGRHALPTWDDAVESLLRQSEERDRG
jgi:Family of unknown function (DUF6084)